MASPRNPIERKRDYFAATQRTYDFSRYADAFDRQQRLIRQADEVQRELDEANAAVAAAEEQMRNAVDMTLAEVRVYVKDERG